MYKILLTLCMVFALSNAQLKESRAKQNFECEREINEQIKREFNASHVYLALASHFSHDRVALYGFAKMFEHSWKEEISHGEKLVNYMIKRGGSVVTPQVDYPQLDFLNDPKLACRSIENALALEKTVNENLIKLHKCAEKDAHQQDFLESEFLDEQVEANKELADLLTKLERATSNTCNGLGLHIIDQELLKKFSS